MATETGTAYKSFFASTMGTLGALSWTGRGKQAAGHTGDAWPEVLERRASTGRPLQPCTVGVGGPLLRLPTWPHQAGPSAAGPNEAVGHAHQSLKMEGIHVRQVASSLSIKPFCLHGPGLCTLAGRGCFR